MFLGVRILQLGYSIFNRRDLLIFCLLFCLFLIQKLFLHLSLLLDPLVKLFTLAQLADQFLFPLPHRLYFSLLISLLGPVLLDLLVHNPAIILTNLLTDLQPVLFLLDGLNQVLFGPVFFDAQVFDIVLFGQFLLLFLGLAECRLVVLAVDLQLVGEVERDQGSFRLNLRACIDHGLHIFFTFEQLFFFF